MEGMKPCEYTWVEGEFPTRVAWASVYTALIRFRPSTGSFHKEERRKQHETPLHFVMGKTGIYMAPLDPTLSMSEPTLNYGSTYFCLSTEIFDILRSLGFQPWLCLLFVQKFHIRSNSNKANLLFIKQVHTAWVRRFAETHHGQGGRLASQTAVFAGSHGGEASPPPPSAARTAYIVFNFASFCLDFESLWGISVESKQEHLVFTADPEIQLTLLLCKNPQESKLVFTKQVRGRGLFKKTSRAFQNMFLQLTKSVRKTKLKTKVLGTAAN